MDGFTRDGLVFDVRDGGPQDGVPVVLLHGFPQDSSAFDRLAPALHGAGLRTLAPDQRGASPGARPAGRAAYSLRRTTADVLGLLDAAGLADAHVVGHDWGAAVGWALAARHAGRVRSLTALSVPHPEAMGRAALTGGQALRSWYMGFFQLPALPEALLTAGGGALLRRSLRRTGLPAAVADRYADRQLQPGALRASLGWYRALPVDARDPIGPVSVPTLHVWGSRDPFIGRAATEGSAALVRGPYRLEVLDGAGHWLPELSADRVGELITAHVRTAG